MNEYDKTIQELWQNVYLAAARKSIDFERASRWADHAVEQYKERFPDPDPNKSYPTSYVPEPPATLADGLVGKSGSEGRYTRWERGCRLKSRLEGVSGVFAGSKAGSIAVRLATGVRKASPSDWIYVGPPPTHATGWQVGATIRHKQHGWEGKILSISCNALMCVEVAHDAVKVGEHVSDWLKVGEHVSDWLFVCGPEGEDEAGYLSR